MTGLNLSDENTFTIAGDDEIFENTDFYGLDFWVKVKSITKSEMRRLRKESTTKYGVDDLLFGSKLFNLCVLDWNITKDNEPLECNEKNKKFVDEKLPILSGKISDKAFYAFHQEEKESESSKKI